MVTIHNIIAIEKSVINQVLHCRLSNIVKSNDPNHWQSDDLIIYNNNNIIILYNIIYFFSITFAWSHK